MADEADDIAEIETRLFLEAIFLRYGYDLRDYSGGSMRRRAAAALAAAGLPHFGELQHRVLHDRAVFGKIMNLLTVRVSEFFRDPSSFRAFRARVVPLLRTYPTLKIWHAGCAGGEEAYSTAILLDEEGLLERAQVYATDLSDQAITEAKEGIYPLASLPVFRRNHAASGATTSPLRWLTAAYDHVAIGESLRQSVLFFQHDLVSDHVFGEMHVVFCRNVLLYFGPELRQRVLSKLAASLCPGGFLCLGSSEGLSETTAIEKRFKPFCASERIYRHEP